MRWGHTRWQAEDFFRRFGPRRRRRNPLLMFWRWRRELVLAVGLPYGLYELAVLTHPVAAAAIALVGLVAIGCWRPGRHLVAERTHAVLVEHRLRVGMVRTGILTWSGWLPAVVWTAPVDRGVRILLWCPAGVDVTAFHANREALAAACWAAGVEVVRHPRRAHLVVVLVVTRPDDR